MIQRITSALLLCLLLFIPFHDIMAENLVTRDSLNNTTDTLKNGFFHRFYRYFQQSNKVRKKRNSISRLSGDRTIPAIPNWDWDSLHPGCTASTVMINPYLPQIFLFTGILRPRVSTCWASGEIPFSPKTVSG